MLMEFEKETCTRCYGSGQYSYCEMYGTTCFKCHGKGKQMTKRGRAAFQWFTAQRKILAQDVTLGMRVGGMGLRITVRTIQPSKTTAKSLQPDGTWKEYTNYLDIRGETHGMTVLPETELEKLPLTNAEKNAALIAAFQYQATLTKAGKPRATKETN